MNVLGGVILRVKYLFPVRGSRTVALAEKTMNETLIRGLERKTNIKNEEIRDVF